MSDTGKLLGPLTYLQLYAITKALRASSPNSDQVWRNSTRLISYKGNFVFFVCKKRP